MPIYALGGIEPQIDPLAYISPEAVVIGDVRIGPEASVWPGAVLRGDESYIEIGARTSVQDGTVVHCTDTQPTIVGDESVIGHIVHLEGCIVEDRALVGSGSVVLHGAIVRTGGLVGANAVVPNRMEVPSGAMALGIPAKLRENAVHPDAIRYPMLSYVARCARYRDELRRLD